MPRTSIPGTQIRDGDIQRIDLDVTTTGQAVLTKVLIDATLEILTSTGVDAGTGDVTLSVKATPASGRIPALSRVRVPGGGTLFLSHGGSVVHTQVPIVISEASVIKLANIAVNRVDTSNDYQLQLFQDPSTSPVFVSALVSLLTNNLYAEDISLSINLPVGNYGLAVVRTSGSGRSDFRRIVGSIFVKGI